MKKIDQQELPFEIGELAKQHDYVQQVKESGFDFSLTVAGAFVRGIRDIGYKSTATALDELIDNSIQAQAENILLEYDFEKGSTRPIRLALIDDGHGMEPDMIRLAIVWGGTHRENDRSGFGRYGYGLPSACVSQAKRFEVYSLTEGGQLFMSWLDLDEILKGEHTFEGGKIIVPEARPVSLPPWLQGIVAERFGPQGWNHGTIIVLDTLDRLNWVTQSALSRNLQQHFGITYRNFLRQVNITVDGKRVEPLDPLFTTPGARYYDLDEDRAEALPAAIIPVKDRDTGEVKGNIRVRFAYLPPTFASRDKSKKAQRGNQNKRFEVMKDHNGIVVCRNGRQIEVVTKVPGTTFLNNDRYWGVELDFPATLDEEFSVTTSKQQVGLSDRVWVLLREHGVLNAIEGMRKRYRSEEKTGTAKAESDGEKRPSEEAMEGADKFKIQRPGGASTSQEKEHKRRLDDEAAKRSETSGRSIEEERDRLREEALKHPYKVLFESLPDAPFYRVDQIGGQKILYLNSDHPFFSQLYGAPDSGPVIRAALEVLLFTFGDCELDSTDDRRTFYRSERIEWSRRLANALSELPKHIDSSKEGVDFESIVEEESSVMEEADMVV